VEKGAGISSELNGYMRVAHARGRAKLVRRRYALIGLVRQVIGLTEIRMDYRSRTSSSP
jgi:hypothetical protein